MKLQGTWCMITGASSGIGLAIARSMRQQGAHLLLIARRPSGLQEAVEHLQPLGNGQLRTLDLDVTDKEACQKKLNFSLQNLPFPDIIVNNAGVVFPGIFGEQSGQQLEGMWQCNLLAPWRILQLLVPEMVKRGSGCIVNVSSMAGLIGVYGYSGYASTKGALVLLSQVLRNELRHLGVRVLLLCPGDTLTPQLEAENLVKPAETKKIASFSPPLHADRVAAALLRQLRRRSGFYIVPGFMNKISWWAYRLAPGLVHRMIDADVHSIWKKKRADKGRN